MMGYRIRTGETERVFVTALDASLNPLTGVTDLLISISRTSDGFNLDFDDNTFKSSGWTQSEGSLVELNSSLSPGVYYFDFDTGAVTNVVTNDSYHVYVKQSPGSTVRNLPQTGELKAGHFVGDVKF